MSDHVHGGSGEAMAVASGVEVDGAGRVFDFFDEAAVAVGTDDGVVGPDTDEAAAAVAPVRGCPGRHHHDGREGPWISKERNRDPHPGFKFMRTRFSYQVQTNPQNTV